MRRSRIKYSEAEMAWLAANRSMIISDYHRAFRAQFARPDILLVHLHALRKRKGWKVGRARGRYVGRHRLFSFEELAWLSEKRTLQMGDLHRAFCTRFHRVDVSAKAIHALRKRKGWKTGRTGCYEKGHVPANKGQKMPFNANSALTQFKKGRAPRNAKFVGHEYVDTGGYVLVSINEVNPHTGLERRYVFKHRLLWENQNGPLPHGYALKCLDGNKLNTDPSNWKALSRAVLCRLNGGPKKKRISYDEAPAELKPTILAAAELAQRAKEVVGSSRKDRQ